jgi:signal transduction histidine kinase
MHAARLHNASINVHSVVGDGTTIVVSFPKDANAFEVVEEHCTEL